MLCLQKRLYGDQRARLPLVIISWRFSVRSRRKLHLSELLRATDLKGAGRRSRCLALVNNIARMATTRWACKLSRPYSNQVRAWWSPVTRKPGEALGTYQKEMMVLITTGASQWAVGFRNFHGRNRQQDRSSVFSEDEECNCSKAGKGSRNWPSQG
jgi:hypothetical protein